MTESILVFAWAAIGAVFGAGVVYATMRLKIQKAQSDVNNVAGVGRENERKAERRWKHMIANEIEELEPKEKAGRVARLLREDAWRN